MNIIPKKITSSGVSSVIPLLFTLVISFFCLVAFIYVQYTNHLRNLEMVLKESDIYSQKMRLNSELMELARSRTRLTSTIIDTEDPFEQDELNMMLEAHAARFALLRSQLLQFPLNIEEQQLLDSHSLIVPVILPAQRRAVELAQNQETDDTEAARKLLYTTVLPGQGRLIASLSRLISNEQENIARLAKESHRSLTTMKERINHTLIAAFVIAFVLVTVVFRRIGNIQERLRSSYKELELANTSLESKVNERTQELKRLNEALQYASEHDALTKLYNRRKFDTFIEYEHARAIRSGEPYSLIMIDIDYFKPYNDHYGHQKGDQCLKEVASVMQENLPRSTDFIARYGGEEFVVLLPATDLEGANNVAESLRQAVVGSEIQHAYSEVEKFVTISQGLAVFDPESGRPYEKIIQEADQQLYLAKSLGRNRVAFTEAA